MHTIGYMHLAMQKKNVHVNLSLCIYDSLLSVGFVSLKQKSLCPRQVAHIAGAYSGFRSINKRLGVLLLPPGWDASSWQGYPLAINSPVPIYTPGWREAL